MKNFTGKGREKKIAHFTENGFHFEYTTFPFSKIFRSRKWRIGFLEHRTESHVSFKE